MVVTQLVTFFIEFSYSYKICVDTQGSYIRDQVVTPTF